MKTKSPIKSVCLPLLFLAGAVAVHAGQFGDFTYESSGTNITITGYTGPGGDVTIPESIASLPVTRIGEWVFSGCTGLTSITLPNSVEEIGWEAFSGCTSLTSITIPNSFTIIRDDAFAGCTSLNAIYFVGDMPPLHPKAGGSIGGESAIVYYRPGTAGGGSTFRGRPTALWIDPPLYSDWLPSSGLLAQYPDTTAEADDPDQDGMTNYAEMLAGTDPEDPASVLMLESVPRPADLAEADRTPLGAGQHAIYFRTVPGKQYGIQWNDSLSRDPGAEWWTYQGLWRTEAVVTATTTQTRFVFDKPVRHAFYRVILAQ